MPNKVNLAKRAKFTSADLTSKHRLSTTNASHKKHTGLMFVLQLAKETKLYADRHGDIFGLGTAAMCSSSIAGNKRWKRKTFCTKKI